MPLLTTTNFIQIFTHLRTRFQVKKKGRFSSESCICDQRVVGLLQIYTALCIISEFELFIRSFSGGIG